MSQSERRRKEKDGDLKVLNRLKQIWANAREAKDSSARARLGIPLRTVPILGLSGPLLSQSRVSKPSSISPGIFTSLHTTDRTRKEAPTDTASPRHADSRTTDSLVFHPMQITHLRIFRSYSDNPTVRQKTWSMCMLRVSRTPGCAVNCNL